MIKGFCRTGDLELQNLSKANLLLVDSDIKNLKVLEVSLKNAGFHVNTALSGKDGLASLSHLNPDLIISDTQISDMSGYDFCEKVKSNNNWNSIPFIFLSSPDEKKDKIRGLELGVEDYLTKPIYMKEIITRVRLVLEKRYQIRLEQDPEMHKHFRGQLADMGVVDLIQTIEVSAKTGVIHLKKLEGAQATIFFKEGKLIDAEAGYLRGEDAVYRVLTWSEGEFEALFRPVRRKRVITKTSNGLLMEGMKRLEEWGQIQEQLPPLEHVYVVKYEELLGQLSDVPDHVNRFIRLFDGKRSLEEIIDTANVGDLEGMMILSKLYFDDMLSPADAEQEEPGEQEPVVAVIDRLSGNTAKNSADIENEKSADLSSNSNLEREDPALRVKRRTSSLARIELAKKKSSGIGKIGAVIEKTKEKRVKRSTQQPARLKTKEELAALAAERGFDRILEDTDEEDPDTLSGYKWEVPEEKEKPKKSASLKAKSIAAKKEREKKRAKRITKLKTTKEAVAEEESDENLSTQDLSKESLSKERAREKEVAQKELAREKEAEKLSKEEKDSAGNFKVKTSNGKKRASVVGSVSGSLSREKRLATGSVKVIALDGIELESKSESRLVSGQPSSRAIKKTRPIIKKRSTPRVVAQKDVQKAGNESNKTQALLYGIAAAAMVFLGYCALKKPLSAEHKATPDSLTVANVNAFDAAPLVPALAPDSKHIDARDLVRSYDAAVPDAAIVAVVPDAAIVAVVPDAAIVAAVPDAAIVAVVPDAAIAAATSKPLPPVAKPVLSKKDKLKALQKDARKARRRGDRFEALQLLSQAEEIQLSSTTLLLKSEILLDMGDNQSAAKVAKELTRAAPRRANGWRILGLAEYENKKYGQAKAAFTRYLELKPDAKDAADVQRLVDSL